MSFAPFKGINSPMILVPFDVNNTEVRQHFLKQTLLDAMNSLTERTQPLWGRMTAQHMVEHLTWTFELSTGRTEVHRDIPENLIARTKKCLYDNTPTPHDFKNPILSENPRPLRFESLADSKNVLREEMNRFLDHIPEKLEVIHNHPLFGPLRSDEWQRCHFKHCYHHLLQFGLIIGAAPAVG